MSVKLDHLVINASHLETSIQFYGHLLPHLGFTQTIEWEWENSDGLTIVLRQATHSSDYQRHGPGLNHFAFLVESKVSFSALYAEMEQAGIQLAAPQTFGESIAVFIPDPDGLRLEIAWEA